MPFVNLKEPSTEQYCIVKRYRTKHKHFKTVPNKKAEQEYNSNESEKGKTIMTATIMRVRDRREERCLVPCNYGLGVYRINSGLDIAIQNTHAWQAFKAKLQCPSPNSLHTHKACRSKFSELAPQYHSRNLQCLREKLDFISPSTLKDV